MGILTSNRPILMPNLYGMHACRSQIFALSFSATQSPPAHMPRVLRVLRALLPALKLWLGRPQWRSILAFAAWRRRSPPEPPRPFPMPLERHLWRRRGLTSEKGEGIQVQRSHLTWGLLPRRCSDGERQQKLQNRQQKLQSRQKQRCNKRWRSYLNKTGINLHLGETKHLAY